MMHHFIYVLSGPGSLIKIGCSREPELRCQTLSRQLGVRLNLVYKLLVARDAFACERAIHRALVDSRLGGSYYGAREWFSLPLDDAKNAIVAVVREKGLDTV